MEKKSIIENKKGQRLDQKNLVQLYQQVFGYIAPPYVPHLKPVVIDSKSKSDLNSPDIFYDQKSIVGTPLVMPLKLDGYQLPNEPLITVSGSKNIIETVIDGQDGTFKELFSLNDYQISIKGFLINDDDPDAFPEDIVRKVRSICETKTSVKCVNKLLSIFRIDYLSIKDFQLVDYEGSVGIQPYQITASSDREFDLELK